MHLPTFGVHSREFPFPQYNEKGNAAGQIEKVEIFGQKSAQWTSNGPTGLPKGSPSHVILL